MQLTNSFITLLLNTFAFKRIKHLHFVEGISFATIPIKDYDEAAAIVRNRLTAIDAEIKDIKKELWAGKLVGRTIKNIFAPRKGKGPKNKEDERRAKTLRTLLVYAGIEKSKWHEYLEEKTFYPGDNRYEDLHGYWYVFRLEYVNNKIHHVNDTIVLKRTLLYIESAASFLTKTSFNSLYNYFESGEIDLRGELLTVRFSNTDKTIEISFNVGEKLAIKNSYLNGILRSTTDKFPFAKQCIIVFADKQGTDVDKKEIVTNCHSGDITDDLKKYGIFSSITTDAIIEYLVRKNKITAKPFSPADINEMRLRNAGAGNNYHILFKEKFESTWFSFSAPPNPKNNISVKEWVFSDSKFKFNFEATCEKKDEHALKAKGSLILTTDKIVLEMENIYDASEMQVIASIANGVGKFMAFTTDLRNNVSYREIFIRKDKAGKFSGSGDLSYEEFLQLDCIEAYEKNSLVNKKENALKWPVYTPEYIDRFSDLAKFAGKYFVYMPNHYDDKKSLSQLTIEIDKLGKVKEVIEYSFEDNPVTAEYFGIASLLKGTLRFSNETAGKQRSEYIFKVNLDEIHNSGYLFGITLDTDHIGFPCADICIAVKSEKISADYVPGTIEIGSEIYVKLENLLGRYINKSLSEYFFTANPSIRDHSRY